LAARAPRHRNNRRRDLDAGISNRAFLASRPETGGFVPVLRTR
jgi:hypothetical protein